MSIEARSVHDLPVPIDGDPTVDRLPSLAAALERLGVECAIEVHGTAVLLTPTDADRPIRVADPASRRAVVTTVRRHGFTHVALVLGDG